MDDKDLPKRVVLNEATTLQRYVINGVPMDYKDTHFVFNCPTCSYQLFEFNRGLSLSQLLSSINEASSQKLKETISHCPHCGQALDYVFDIIEGEVVSSEENTESTYSNEAKLN